MRRPSDSALCAGLALLAVVLALPYAIVGPNFILDDWFTLARSHFEGAMHTDTKAHLLTRPVGYLTYVMTFGLIGRHPLPIFLVQLLIEVATVIVLFKLAARFLPRNVALGIAAAWLIIPNHGSLLYWASATNIALSLLLLLLGAFLITNSDARSLVVVAGVALLIASVLTYEATLPMACVIVLVTPFLTDKRFSWRASAISIFAIAVVALWQVANWDSAKDPIAPQLLRLPGAHLGWGVVDVGSPFLASLSATVGLTVVILCLAQTRRARVRLTRNTPASLILAGIVVIVAGTIPFTFYYYSPVGPGDRVNVVASIGTAMLWTGVIWYLTRFRTAAVAIALLLCSAAVLTSVQRQLVYADTGEQGLEILALASREPIDRSTPIAIGPCLTPRKQIVAFLDPSNVGSALSLQFEKRGITGYMTFSKDEFLAVPESRRVDVRKIGITCERAEELLH